ncbi:RICIN domain-containing protein [Streptomyces mirabilis]|uniref:RICIN domain-containing protein n=1 Tax=Streptomyces mirabilis TaxID=68239 RepID=UPI0036AB27FC
MGRQEALRALPCTDSGAQLWWESSRAVPSDSWHTGRKWVRLRADNGSYLDARGGGTDDLTRVIVHPRKNVDNQFWDIQDQNYSDNLVAYAAPQPQMRRCRQQRHRGPRSPLRDLHVRYPGTKNDNTGQRWIAETDPYGDIRLRNEATHLCLTAPDAEIGQVAVEVCSTSPRQVWEPEP